MNLRASGKTALPIVGIGSISLIFAPVSDSIARA